MANRNDATRLPIGEPARLGPVVVFDCETDTTFATVIGTDRNEKMRNMQVTVVCAEELEVGAIDAAVVAADAADPAVAPRLITCWRDDNDAEGGPFEALFAAFDGASLIVAYNGIDFDMPVLRKYYSSSARYMRHKQKLHDPFDRIRSNTGLWVGLGTLLSHNGLPTKTGSGVDAVRLWEEGHRDELMSYCANDVTALTRLVLRRAPLVIATKRPRPSTSDVDGPITVSAAVFSVGAALAGLRWAQ